MITVNSQIKFEDDSAYLIAVEVVEGATKTTHTVQVNKKYYYDLTGGKISVSELVEKSFDFLLKRETKGAIMRSFELSEIKGYYPVYEKEMREWIRDSSK